MPEPIRWYMDEHVPSAVTEGLRRRGIDVVTIQELHETGALDAHHVDLATALGRAIFTQDADYLRIAAAGQPHTGIVYTHQTTPIGDIVRGLLLITEIYTAEEMVNRVEFV
jgi:predicted nuclease of predicted toxin-antitoxin system